MAGLLGLVLGGALGYNKQQNQQQQAGREKMADMTLQLAMNGHPEVLQTPEAQKMVSGVYGKDMLGVVQSVADKAQQAQQQFQAQMRGGQSSQPPPSGLPTAAGMSSAAGPSSVPTSGDFIPSPTALMGSMQPAAAPQTAPTATPAPSNWDNPQTAEDWQNKANVLSDMQANPLYQGGEFQSIIKQHLDEAQRNVSELRSLEERKSEHADTSNRLQQAHEDSVALQRSQQAIEAQGQSLSAQAHADSTNLAKQYHESENYFKQVTANQTAAQAAETTRTHFAAQTANLQARIDKLATQTPTQAALSIPNINGDMKTLKAQADKAGIDYDSSMFTPLKVGKVPGKFWGTNPGIVRDEASAPAAAVPDTPVADAPMPVMRGGKLIGHTTDGKNYIPLP